MTSKVCSWYNFPLHCMYNCITGFCFTLFSSLESVYITPTIFGVGDYKTLTYWRKSWKSTFRGVTNSPKLSNSWQRINSIPFKKVKQSDLGMYFQSLRNMKRNEEPGNSLCLYFNFWQLLTILWRRSLSYRIPSIDLHWMGHCEATMFRK